MPPVQPTFQQPQGAPQYNYGRHYQSQAQSGAGMVQDARLQMIQMANAPAAAQTLPALPSISAQAIAAGPQDYNALLQQLQLDAIQSMQQPYTVQMLPPPGQMQFNQPQIQVTGPVPLLPTPANQQGFVPIAATQQGFRPITAP